MLFLRIAVALYNHKRENVIFNTALIFGNEALGIAPEAQAASDGIIGLPMFGSKESINVGNCAVAVLYAIVARYNLSKTTFFAGIIIMKVKLIGKNLEDIIPLLATYGFETVDKNPELLIAHGGDGTLLAAEREFPGIPKLPLRDSRTAPLCKKHAYAKQLSAFSRGLATKSTLIKLSGICGERTITGMNDVFIHNLERIRAMRYRVWIDEQLYANEIVGDSVGMATPHGSTAYYRSITHSIFRVGLGLAFSNSTELVNHLVLPETAVVRIQIIRGPAEAVADNSPAVVRLQKNDEVLIRKSENLAIIHGIDNFMCQGCRLLRHPNQHPVDHRHTKSGKKR